MSPTHQHQAGAPHSAEADKLPGIRHIIAVASGKGGVGKSTVAVNLALALQMRGVRVGLVDADILGPSIPGMLGIPSGKPPDVTDEGRAIPIERYGVVSISMAMITGDDTPAVLRGPMVSKYVKMFIDGTQWGELDYLLLDLPPGTGDTQLTLAQSFPLSGAVIVTTPQDVSLKIARRGLRMFERVHVPILGIIENMSGFTCAHCGEITDVFRRGGGERMSQELAVPYLGAIPLDADIVTGGDEGCPIVIAKPDSIAAQAYTSVAAQLAGQLDKAPASPLKPFIWQWDNNEGAPEWAENASRPGGIRATPIGLRRHDLRTLAVLWEDGHRDHFDVRDLRLNCRCALCIEEMSGRKLLDPLKVRADVRPRTISSIGNYAIGVDWSDGHNSGLYSFDSLRSLGERIASVAAEDV